jgi:hypothetical protein
MRIRKSLYLLLLILVMFLKDAFPQTSQVLYYMNIPQNHLDNPALRPTNSSYIGIPMLTGFDFTLNNNFVNFSDIIMKGQKNDSLISVLHKDYDIDKFINKLKASNFITPEISIQILGLGFTVGKDMYVTLDMVDRIYTNIAIPKDLFLLALKGNGSFVGSTMDLSGFDAQIRYWHEFGMGISKNFGNNLRLGIRPKVLFGVADFSINNQTFGLTVNQDYSWEFNANLTANLSGPVNVYTSSKNTIDSIKFDESKFKKGSGNDADINKIANFFFNKQNMGLGVDLGAQYSVTSKLQVSASVTDLGYIRWKSDVTNLKAESSFKFNGFNVTDVVNGSKTMDQLAQDMADSLKNSFSITNGSKPYNTSLPLGFNLGGSYNLTKNISIGILSHSILNDKKIREALTLSANINLGSALSTSICYTAENGRFDNLGAGLAFRLGIFQLYFIADRIPVTFNKITSDNNSFMVPATWNTFNTRFGVNLAFGNNVKKKTDKPMIIEKK